MLAHVVFPLPTHARVAAGETFLYNWRAIDRDCTVPVSESNCIVLFRLQKTSAAIGYLQRDSEVTVGLEVLSFCDVMCCNMNGTAFEGELPKHCPI